MSMAVRPAPSAAVLIRLGRAVSAGSGTRHVLDEAGWAALADRLHADPLPVVTLWADGEAVHALFLPAQDAPLVASVAPVGRRVLALSPARPELVPCERSLRDLWGIEAMGARDLRPWLDHGHWNRTAPLSERPGPAGWPPEPPEFLVEPVEREAGAFQLAIGPIQHLVAGPAMLRVTLDGERMMRLEPLLGSGHRGIPGSCRGRMPIDAVPLVSRIDAAATVAHQTAFARAVEAATAIAPPSGFPRDAMAALERAALGLHHLARLGRLAGLHRPARQAAILREALLDASGHAFGHRLMLDRIVPGAGVPDPDPDALRALAAALENAAAHVPVLHRALLDGASATGRLPSCCRAPVARRLEHLAADLSLGRQGLAERAGREPAAAPTPASGEGLGMADALHGTVWHWVWLREGRIAAFHVHDPVLPAWLDLAARAVGQPADALPLLCAALGLSSAGADQ